MENLLRDENILLNQSISTQEEAIEKSRTTTCRQWCR